MNDTYTQPKPIVRVPARYEGATYADVPSNIKALFEKIRESRKGIYLHGGVGTGKTHISYALHRSALDVIQLKSRFFNTTEMFREIRLDMHRQPNEKRDIEQELMDNRGLIFLDDIGAEKISDWVLETFYLFINHRYEERLPTIFTSNFNLEDLCERIGERTVSRVYEMCDVIELGGADRRMETPKAKIDRITAEHGKGLRPTK